MYANCTWLPHSLPTSPAHPFDQLAGRVDDVINVSGHRIGTAEVESALVAHPQCAEAAVVGYEHPVKGQGEQAWLCWAAQPAAASLLPASSSIPTQHSILLNAATHSLQASGHTSPCLRCVGVYLGGRRAPVGRVVHGRGSRSFCPSLRLSLTLCPAAHPPFCHHRVWSMMTS